MSFCGCGCGLPTNLATHNDASKGWVKGQPLRFIHQHPTQLMRELPEDELITKIFSQSTRDEHGCWVWAGRLCQGYGVVGVGNRKSRAAHIVSYECHVGPVPDGLELDHLCRNPACVNPAHLEPVTHAENMRRAARFRALPVQCKHGHEFTAENTKWRKEGGRACRECARERNRRYMERMRAKAAA